MSESDQVSGKQIAAARALIGLGQVELAEKARISAPTLRRMEASEGPVGGVRNNVIAVIDALVNMGIEFIDGGVRLRDR